MAGAILPGAWSAGERARGKGERKGREAVGEELSMFGEWGYGGYIVSLMVYGVGMD